MLRFDVCDLWSSADGCFCRCHSRVRDGAQARWRSDRRFKRFMATSSSTLNKFKSDDLPHQVKEHT